MKSVEPADPIAWVGQFEKDIGLPAGFLVNLLIKEDDWSFIIKLHALVEAAVSHLLATICGEELLTVFTRLQLSSETVGKLAFAKALHTLDTDTSASSFASFPRSAIPLPMMYVRLGHLWTHTLPL